MKRELVSVLKIINKHRWIGYLGLFGFIGIMKLAENHEIVNVLKIIFLVYLFVFMGCMYFNFVLQLRAARKPKKYT